jgi:hypothetical protein
MINFRRSTTSVGLGGVIGVMIDSIFESDLLARSPALTGPLWAIYRPAAMLDASGVERTFAQNHEHWGVYGTIEDGPNRAKPCKPQLQPSCVVLFGDKVRVPRGRNGRSLGAVTNKPMEFAKADCAQRRVPNRILQELPHVARSCVDLFDDQITHRFDI